MHTIFRFPFGNSDAGTLASLLLLMGVTATSEALNLLDRWRNVFSDAGEWMSSDTAIPWHVSTLNGKRRKG